MLFAPKTDIQYNVIRDKKIIKTRPMPDSQVARFENELINYPWALVFEGASVNEKVDHFHGFLKTQLDNLKAI